MSIYRMNKADLLALAAEQSVEIEEGATNKQIADALIAAGYVEPETATDTPAAVAGDGDTTVVVPKALPAQRVTTNTVYCGLCGTAFRLGANPGDPCPACGTPAILPSAVEAEE